MQLFDNKDRDKTNVSKTGIFGMHFRRNTFLAVEIELAKAIEAC